MKIKTNVKAGGRRLNHNETIVRSGLKTRTQLKAGCHCGVVRNHNETIVRSGLTTKSHLKAGCHGVIRNHNETLVQTA